MQSNQVPDFIYDPEKNEYSKVTTSTTAKEDDYEDQCTFFFANGNNKTTVTLGAYDPKNEHLTVVPGLNLKGKCNNKNCRAYQHKKTWIRLGYGTFELPKNMLNHKCRGCNEKISYKSIQSLGYSRAKISIVGIKMDQNDNEVEVKLDFQEKQGKFTYFMDNKEDVQEFVHLEIVAKKA